MAVITEIEDLRRLHRRRAPRMFYDYADSGAWTEGTYRANEEDFAALLRANSQKSDISSRTSATAS